MKYSMPVSPVLHHLLEFAQIHAHWVSDAIRPSRPLLPSSPLASNLSWHQGLFQWVGSLHQLATVLELQLQHQSFNEYSGLISFRIDWFDLLAVQDSLKSLFQYHSVKACILQYSAFFMIHLLPTYMTTGKTIDLTVWTFVSKVMALLFNMFRLLIAFHPRSKCLLISYTVILEPQKRKSIPVSTFSPSICHEVIGPDAMILVFWMLSFKPTFSLSPFTIIKKLFSSCCKGGVICISEVIDISPSNLDSSLCFSQPDISHDTLHRS